jgi:prophage regulatory protein
MKLIRLPQVMERVGLSKTTIYEQIKRGAFPAPTKIGSASAWSELEVDDWVRQALQLRTKDQRP